MALTSGTKLGPYEIHSSLGAGGMGEVYRARDSRLERDVAIKVLPASLSSDPSLRQRLEREAKAISKLSHPNICALHDIGQQDGMVFLVMELLEGETLEQRLHKGPLSPEQTISYGAQIADALSKVHKLGFIHRDLKPSNIMLTKTGPKLLDFGLAKQSAASAIPSSLTGVTAEQSKLTEEGMLVGTFNYMAPEQLEGREADVRTDIFALGDVLYEMATGKPPFGGKSRANLIASILSAEPTPVTQLRPMVPASLERVILKCLAKDPDDRWQSASDLASELRWISEVPFARLVSPAKPASSQRKWINLAALTLAAGAGVAVGVLLHRPEEKPRLRVAINLPSGSHLAINKQVVLSPNAQLIAMILADADGKTRLWVRRLTADAAQPINDSEGAMAPFWSPDSQFVGFFTFENKLKTVALSDGTVQMLCDTGPGTDADLAGTWSRDGVIVFSTRKGGFFRIPASGGLLDNIPVDGDYRWPFFLPDGHHFLALSGNAGIVAIPLEGGPAHAVLPHEGGPARYADAGYILFTRQRDLLVQPFDLRRLGVTGSPETVAASVEPGPFSFSAAASSLLYVQTSETQLTWVDQEGNQLSTVGEPGHVSAPFLSPDGHYAMASITDPETQKEKLWLFDFQRGTQSPFAFGAGNDSYPVWSPDSKQVAFTSVRENGQEDIFLKPVNGGGSEQPLLTLPGDKEPDKFSPDGRFLIFDYRARPGEGYDIWILPMFGDRKPYPFIERRGNDAFATFSPDGKWVAYLSDESGQPEVYVVPFPGPGGKWRISKNGGGQPIWPEGKELFYVSNAFQMIGVQFEVRDNNLVVGKSRRLFEGTAVGASLGTNPDASASIDANRDGSRWLVAMPVDARNASPLIFTNNWLSHK
jgi:serine/threonine protein kinase/Tol biopolymer transport system component